MFWRADSDTDDRVDCDIGYSQIDSGIDDDRCHLNFGVCFFSIGRITVHITDCRAHYSADSSADTSTKLEWRLRAQFFWLDPSHIG